jgi:hypothetical protein
MKVILNCKQIWYNYTKKSIQIKNQMDNDFQDLNKNVPNLYSHFVKSEEVTQDPVSTFLKILHSGKGLKVNLPSTEDKELYESDDDKRKGVTEVNFKDTNPMVDFKPTKLPHLGYTRSPLYPTAGDKYVLRLLREVPVYSVVNGVGEIIVSSPRSLKTLNFFDWVYERYFNNFIWEKDEGPVNLALYFMNEEDAKLYLHEICVGDPRGVQEYGLGIQCSGLDKYYHLNRTAPPKTQVKLIGDLKEVDIVVKYIKNKSPKVNPKQLYTSNSFKGTPIYVVHGFGRDHVGVIGVAGHEKDPHELVFFNKTVLDYHLRLSRPRYPKPTFEIYNLESYLLDLKVKGRDTAEEPTETDNPILKVEFWAGHEDERLKSPRTYAEFKETFETKMKSLRRFCKGIVWLLTSDALPTEDKSW